MNAIRRAAASLANASSSASCYLSSFSSFSRESVRGLASSPTPSPSAEDRHPTASSSSSSSGSGLQITSNGLYQITATGRVKPISKGDIITAKRSFSFDDVKLFTTFTGDQNPIHRDVKAAVDAGFDSILVPGSLSASIFPAVLGTLIPGAAYVSQTLRFEAAAKVDAPIECRIEVLDAAGGGRRVRFSTKLLQEQRMVVSGEAVLFLKARGLWISRIEASRRAERAGAERERGEGAEPDPEGP